MSSLIPSGTTTTTTTTTTSSSYWCYSCSRFVRASPEQPISCPDCHRGFLELIRNTPPPSSADRRRNRRHSVGHGSPFNPVIVLRGSLADAESPPSNPNPNTFELFYDDGAGTGLRPLPRSISNFVMGSEFNQLLDQLSQTDSTPASKTAVESLPTVTISDENTAAADSCCAVCMEALEVGDDAQEMPCKHMFHKDCIVPWLSLRNSCPVCRRELPRDVAREREGSEGGLRIWRLPGGGFAVGRFGGVRSGERELPVVYGEMDGGLSGGTRILWASRGRRLREQRGVGRMFHGFFSMFRCFSPSSLASSGVRLGSSEEATSAVRPPFLGL